MLTLTWTDLNNPGWSLIESFPANELTLSEVREAARWQRLEVSISYLA